MINYIVKMSIGAMVVAFSMGSAIAAEPVDEATVTESVATTSIMPQNVQPMAAAELDTVRGMWDGKLPGAAGNGSHGWSNYGGGEGCPPGIQKNR